MKTKLLPTGALVAEAVDSEIQSEDERTSSFDQAVALTLFKADFWPTGDTPGYCYMMNSITHASYVVFEVFKTSDSYISISYRRNNRGFDKGYFCKITFEAAPVLEPSSGVLSKLETLKCMNGCRRVLLNTA